MSTLRAWLRACFFPCRHSKKPNQRRRARLTVEALEPRLTPANTPPLAPGITEPNKDGAAVSAFDVHMQIGPFVDPDAGDTHKATDWEIWTTPAPGAELVWKANNVTDPLTKGHIHLGDGTFVNSLAGKQQLNFDTNYRLQARVRDSSNDPATDWSLWSSRLFHTDPELQPIPGVGTWAVKQPGYKVEAVAGGFQLPVNIAFVPNPGTHPDDPLFYVVELYGQIKVVTNDGAVSDYATGLLNFNPTGDFPGSGEQGVAGIVVEPTTGDLFVTLLYDAGGPHYPKIIRLHSTDGGRTKATETIVLAMPGEPMGQSHQISNISIGPDGKLYVHIGDGFDLGTPQNLDSFRGKIIRLNQNGTAPSDNPFYNAADGISARDYVFAYGYRNPFGGGWRAADAGHYVVENGPSVDRLSKLVAGRNYLYDGSDASMGNFAIYNWNPAHAPVNLAYIQSSTFGGSRFPANDLDHMFVSESGPTYATGPQSKGKRISEFVLDAAGNLISGPTALIEYNGTGKASVAALAAGPNGLYFSDLYPDAGQDPTAPAANVLRVRYIGTAAPVAPTNLAAQGLSPTQIRLTWIDASDNEDGFRIEQSTDGVNFTQVATTAANKTSFTLGGLQTGVTYHFRVRAFNSDFGNGPFSNIASAYPPGFFANVNFQPSGVPIPSGYVADTGLAFGDRGNGLSFGWSQSNVESARDRDAPNSPDQRYDTLIHFGGNSWEIAVPNASYTVHLVAGDPSYFDSTYKINVEGVLAIDGSPTDQQLWLEGTVTVTVGDGKLTVAQAAGAINPKVNFIDIIATATPSIPAAPVGLTATAGDKQVSLTWSASTGAQTYSIYRGLTSGGQSPTPIATGIAATSFLDSGLTNGTTYYYKVTAVNNTGESPKSTEASATPQVPPAFSANVNFQPASAAVPAGYVADTGLIFGNRGNGYTYGWDADATAGTRDRDNPASPDQRYDTLSHLGAQIWEIAVANGNYSVHLVAGDPSYFDSVHKINVEGVLTIDGTPTPANPWLEATKTVTVSDGKLTVATAAGASNAKVNFIDIATAQAPSVPAAPTGLSATAGDKQVALAWNASPGAVTYNVYRGITSDGQGDTPIATGVTSTSFTDSGLTNGTTYYYKVTAVNAAGESPRSNEASATPQVAPPFSAKINFQPASAPVPPGYAVDGGAVFGNRGNDMTYGWNLNNAANTRDRNAPNSPDQRYDTLTHLENRTWEIAVANGSYTVHVVAGDPIYLDSIHKIDVEGLLAINGSPTVANPWLEATVTVTVGDGKLTVKAGAGAVNAKINFIDISQLGGGAGGSGFSGGSSSPPAGSGLQLIFFTVPSAPGLTTPASDTATPTPQIERNDRAKEGRQTRRDSGWDYRSQVYWDWLRGGSATSRRKKGMWFDEDL
jgi:glucose/arabinose dehydrogenase/fibronectin type 3 domain-containing protein